MRIVKVSKEDEFLRLKEQWNFLLSASGLNNIFLTWEWLYSWWKVFKGKNDELFIVVGMEGTEISAIAPCYINKGFYKKICFLGSGIACSEYLSLIVSQEDRVPFVYGICEYLNVNRNEWDLISFEALRSNDEVIVLLKDCIDSKKWRWMISREQACPYLPLSTLEELKKIMSSSLIKNMLTGKRRLSSKGRVEYKELSCPDQKEALSNYDIVVSLHQKRWQTLKDKTGGIFSNELMLEFLRIVTGEFSKNGWLSIVCLTFDGKPVAAEYNFKFNNKVWGYVKGYDPSYKYYTPGLICLWESLQFYIDSGYREFDFLRGGEGYKNTSTDKFHIELDILITKKNLKCFLFLVDLSFKNSIKKCLKKMIPARMYDYLRVFKFNRNR